jgi:hypothetical protein
MHGFEVEHQQFHRNIPSKEMSLLKRFEEAD